MIDGPSLPTNQPGKASATPLGLSFTVPFEPSASVRGARIGATEWSSAWQGKAIGLPRGGGARPLLSARPGHAAGVLLLDQGDTMHFWVTSKGALRPLARWDARREPVNGYVDARGKLWLVSSNCEGAARLVDASNGVASMKLGPAHTLHQHNRKRDVAKYALPPCPGFANPHSVAVGPQGQLAVLRLPSGNDPASLDDPALVLTSGAEPIALAPWSTLELASGPACAASKDGYRALIQTPNAWLAAERQGGAAPGMSAIVRWSKQRVCLEAVETPHDRVRSVADTSEAGASRLVARFVGEMPGETLVFRSASGNFRQAVTCQVTAPATAP